MVAKDGRCELWLNKQVQGAGELSLTLKLGGRSAAGFWCVMASKCGSRAMFRWIDTSFAITHVHSSILLTRSLEHHCSPRPPSRVI